MEVPLNFINNSTLFLQGAHRRRQSDCMVPASPRPARERGRNGGSEGAILEYGDGSGNPVCPDGLSNLQFGLVQTFPGVCDDAWFFGEQYFNLELPIVPAGRRVEGTLRPGFVHVHVPQWGGHRDRSGGWEAQVVESLQERETKEGKGEIEA